MRQHVHLPIGIFDSGLGGLTVVKEITRLMPSERLIYVGDTARVPYGTKSPDTIRRYSLQIAKFLYKKKVKAIVVACNTASSVALDALRSFPVPVIGVIEPGARAASRVSKTKKIGVIGTPATIASRSYDRALNRYIPRAHVWTRACPLFVPLVEEGRLDDSITRAVITDYLRPIKKSHVDTLVLGCTHYPLLKNAMKKVLGRRIQLVDSAQETAKELKHALEERKWIRPSKSRGSVVFYTTDNVQFFTRFGVRFLGRKIRPVKFLPLEKL